jgi:hypothetical protein
MGQPVKLSDNLMLDARLVAEESERSIAGQIEYWARLGRAIESAIRAPTALKLRRQSALLAERLREVGTPAGRARVAALLASGPFPHFEAVPGRPGLLVKIDEDGTRTLGRFVKRTFTPVKDH